MSKKKDLLITTTVKTSNSALKYVFLWHMLNQIVINFTLLWCMYLSVALLLCNVFTWHAINLQHNFPCCLVHLNYCKDYRNETFGMYLVWFSAGNQLSWLQLFNDFHESHQVIASIYHNLDYVCFLPYPYLFIIHNILPYVSFDYVISGVIKYLIID